MTPERPITLGLNRLEPGSPYAQLCKSLATAIDNADPVGLVKHGAPGDEYSAELATIVPRVARSHAADEVVDILQQEFSRRFGEQIAGSREAYESLAAEMWQAVLDYRRVETDSVVIDVSTVFDAWALHALMAEKLGFPSYYGMNWDAFQ